MAQLVADRFIRHGGVTVDAATSARVTLRIGPAGSRHAQQAWADRCGRALDDPRQTLIDFGLLGTNRRFEAHGPVPSGPDSSRADSAREVEWIDHAKVSSPRILYLSSLPNPRDLRQCGVVPIGVRLLECSPLVHQLWPLITGRSVALLDARDDRPALCMAILHLTMRGAREVHAFVRRSSDGPILVARAAEGRALYEARPPRRFDARASNMLNDAERLITRGRHAAAERTMRAALAAFDRRRESLNAGHASMRLGRLLLDRGRAADACSLFEGAREKFQEANGPSDAVSACLYVGLARTDLGNLDQGETALRAAYSAAAALGESEHALASTVGLARNLLWQGRFSDAAAILEAAAPEGGTAQCARYWCVAARLKLAQDDLTGAWQAVERARRLDDPDPLVEAIVRTSEAAVQARLGDVEALDTHVRAGLAAARVAYQPLHAFRLRLTQLDGLIAARRMARARALVRRLGRMARRTIPPPLKRRLESLGDRLENGGGTAAAAAPAAHEAVARFRLGTGAAHIGDIDGLTRLLSLCHDLDDGHEALARAVSAIRKQTRAAGVGLFGALGALTVQCGSAGTVSAALARRVIDCGQSIGPESGSSVTEAAFPIRYLGRVIGSLAIRWSVEGPDSAERANAFGAAAAAVCAPLIYLTLEKRASAPSDQDVCDLIGIGPAIEDVRRAIARAANAPFTVLIEGESGSGKELVARAIHRGGCRRERRWCALNCAAMPEDLVDAELFGHARGAFTGASIERVGLFESADGGTVFLDEVGELSARAQAKLLRVLQEGEIRRIGENVTRSIDARLVAATNRSLKAEVEAGRFRQDLLYRLDVIRIAVPPLRDRVEDIPLLAARFWRQSAERIGSKAVLSHAAISALARYDWPGNVRELQNVLTGLVVNVPSRGVVGASDMPAAIARAVRPMSPASLESARLEFEQRFVRAALARAAGHRGRAAMALGLSRQGLAKLMQRLHLDA